MLTFYNKGCFEFAIILKGCVHKLECISMYYQCKECTYVTKISILCDRKKKIRLTKIMKPSAITPLVLHSQWNRCMIIICSPCKLSELHQDVTYVQYACPIKSYRGPSPLPTDASYDIFQLRYIFLPKQCQIQCHFPSTWLAQRILPDQISRVHEVHV